MSRFQIQARYDRTLKTTSCSRAWSTTLRLKSSFGPTSRTDPPKEFMSFAAAHLVAFWHKADIPMLSTNVRF
jgi:hypothetical protein